MSIRANLVSFFLVALIFSFCPSVLFAAAPQQVPAASGGPGAADVKILVLPFQINADASMDRLHDELPALLTQRLLAKGVAVVPEREVLNLLRREKIATVNIQIVRGLARRLGATAAVYGSYSQVGDAFTIDARYVEVGEGEAVRPFFVERPQVIELLPAVDELAARVSNEARRRETVAEVEVRGTRVLDSDVVLMRINTRKGDVLDLDALDREVKRIWDLGYFSDIKVTVEPQNDGLHLVYTVVEKPRIENIVVEGNDDIDEDDILAVMTTKQGSVLNEKLLSEDLQKIIEVFRKDGYYLATVTPRVDTRQDGLVLTVNEGNKLYIKEVVIEGAEQLPADDVADQLMLKTRGWLSWLTGSGVLQEELLERDSGAITAYYLNNGFMDVEVGAPKVRYEEDGIVVTFQVKEGQRYKVGDIHFSGDLIDTDEVLRRSVKMDDIAAEDGYFSLQAMQDDNQTLTAFYAEYGYAFAEVNPVPEKRPDGEAVVDIIYYIDKKQKVYIRRAFIEGNTRTRDNVILRELRLTDGDLFVGSRLQRSTERLNRLNYFEVAEAELVPTSNEEEVDLKVTVREKSTGSIMAGVGYSTYSSFGVSGTIAEKNLFGKGYAQSLTAGFSGRRTAYTYSFTNPRVYDSELSAGIDLYHWRDDYYDYIKKTVGGTVRFSYPIGEYSAVGWGYRLDFYKLYDFDEDASPLIRDYGGNRVSSVLMGRISRDTTNAIMPTRGTANEIEVEYGGGILGGDDKFILTTFEHNSYYSLRPNNVLHLRGKLGAIFENGDKDVPVFDRFWVGGMDSIRGYSAKDIVPRDPRTGDRLGGTRMGYLNLEYIWGFAPEMGLHLVPFFDIGFNLDHQQKYTWSDEIKRSFGLELRWRSPMGDLRFGYGIPLDKDRKGDKTGGRFEFAMGQFF